MLASRWAVLSRAFCRLVSMGFLDGPLLTSGVTSWKLADAEVFGPFVDVAAFGVFQLEWIHFEAALRALLAHPCVGAELLDEDTHAGGLALFHAFADPIDVAHSRPVAGGGLAAEDGPFSMRATTGTERA